MSKVLLGVIGAMAVSGYAYYYLSVSPLKVENKELFEENTAFELAMKEQQETIRRIEENIEKTKESLNKLTKKNQQYEQEQAEFLDIFRRHNLAQLASAKPGLITIRANKRTQEVFDAIEADSKRISSLND
jgi:adenylate kinase family enzyme